MEYLIKEFRDVKEKLIALRPELIKTESLIETDELTGFKDFFILYKDRSCQFLKVDSNLEAWFSFYWDGCKLFEIKNDLHLMSKVIYDWLIWNIMPSELEKKYNWISTGKLASYYEKGEGVKGEFIHSWDKIKEFYKEFLNYDRPYRALGENALKLIKEMMELGLDQQLRSGQSTSLFFLSRARRPWLTKDDPYIKIAFSEQNQMYVQSYFGEGTSYFEALESFSIDDSENFTCTKHEAKGFICDVEYEGEFKELVEKLLKEKIR